MKFWFPTRNLFNVTNCKRTIFALRIAFNSLGQICREVNFGWILRMFHANGARFFYLPLYSYRGENYYGSYNFEFIRITGATILLLVIATAFLGYVLP